ncbi:phytoene/squalene synthase family protein [Labrys monachus]|uniref:Phytoene synthase n=1 Tax=Labrys monachus TaxID=217067 RepID=A0ABU0FEG0_9HYPH|nr:phytoene/squalene synthase family protein [Labrys monachus]MDQ0392995.1 phytoene synthase [Labrys monachus]
MTVEDSPVAPADLAYCEDLLRELDRDAWLACLFAPAEHRAGLFALHAFNCEIVRVRDAVSAPLPGEVRLQWWRDLLDDAARGGASGNPVAAALIATIGRYALPRAALTALVDAHVHDLYDDLLPTVTDLEGYCGETASALFRLASLILADGGDAGPADLAGHAGVAQGIAGLLKNAARHAARGQIFVPADIVARHQGAQDDILNGRDSAAARAAFADVTALGRKHLAAALALLPSAPAAVAPAFLPLALIEPVLRRVARPGFNLFRDRAEPPQWRRQWHLWRFGRRLRSLKQ